MRTLYLECNMGAAGDMLTAALLELVEEPESMLEGMNRIGMEKVQIKKDKVTTCGIQGTQLDVLHQGKDVDETNGFGYSYGDGDKQELEDRHNLKNEYHEMEAIEKAIRKLKVSAEVKRNAIGIFQLIADAESHVQGRPVSKVHVHEAGVLNAIANIVGVCLLMEEINPEKVLASPIHLGSGTVQYACGVLPVPTPVTAQILMDVPVYQDNVKGELCTPTGAAIIKYFADDYGFMPIMSIDKIGYGMGRRDIGMANYVRAFLGESSDAKNGMQEEVVELSCHMDDMTEKEIGFACKRLLGNGALDVYTVPIRMKTNRPGILLVCICEKRKLELMSKLMLRHTTTFGVRGIVRKQYALHRKFTVIPRKNGDVNMNKREGYERTISKPEYEEVTSIARTKGLNIYDVMNGLRNSMEE